MKKLVIKKDGDRYKVVQDSLDKNSIEAASKFRITLRGCFTEETDFSLVDIKDMTQEISSDEVEALVQDYISKALEDNKLKAKYNKINLVLLKDDRYNTFEYQVDAGKKSIFIKIEIAGPVGI